MLAQIADLRLCALMSLHFYVPVLLCLGPISAPLWQVSPLYLLFNALTIQTALKCAYVKPVSHWQHLVVR